MAFVGSADKAGIRPTAVFHGVKRPASGAQGGLSFRRDQDASARGAVRLARRFTPVERPAQVCSAPPTNGDSQATAIPGMDVPMLLVQERRGR